MTRDGGIIMKHYTIQKILLVTIAVYLAMLGSACSTKQENAPAGIKIGVTFPLTGEMGAWGERAKNGALLGVKQVNSKRSGDDQFKLIMEDTKSLPATGVTIITKLINVDKVKFVIGDLSSGVTLAMAPIAEQAQVLLLAPGASSPNVRDAGEYIFRDWTSDDYDGSVLARAAKSELNAKTVAIFYQDNTYSEGLATAFKNEAAKISLNVIAPERIPGSAKNYRDIIEKYRNRSFDLIFLAAHSEQSAQFFKQAKEAGLKQIMVGCVAIEGPEFLKMYPGADDIYYSSIPLAPERNPVFAEFAKKYKAEYGVLPDVAAAHAYDAVLLYDRVIPSAKTTVEQAKQSLLKLKNFPGATGIMSFDEKGDVKKPVVLMKYVKGIPITIKTFPIE